MRVLRRSKLSGIGTHDGLQLDDGTVIDLTQDEGIQLRSMDAFSQGRTVIVVRTIDRQLYWSVMSNVRRALFERRPYHVTDWNCERFVNWLICEPPESHSVNGWAIVTVVAMVAAFALRA